MACTDEGTNLVFPVSLSMSMEEGGESHQFWGTEEREKERDFNGSGNKHHEQQHQQGEKAREPVGAELSEGEGDEEDCGYHGAITAAATTVTQ